MEELGAEGGRRRGEGEGEIVSSSPERNGSGGLGGGQKGDFLSTFSLPIENKWDKKVWLGGEGGGGRGGCEFNPGRSRISR